MEIINYMVIFCCLLQAGWANTLCDTTDLEPCLLKKNLELPYLNTRHPSVDFSASTDDYKYCDLFALDHGKWYWSSYNMTNYCVDHRKCGTNDPIYLNGSLPSPEDGVVDATACVRTFEDCCENSLNLKLKNCGFYMVYCFIEIESSCHSRFCFDVDLGVETTQATQATSIKPDNDSGDDDDEKRRKPKAFTGEAKTTEIGWIVTVVVLIVIILALLAVIIYICRRRNRSVSYMVEKEAMPKSPPPYEDSYTKEKHHIT